eukprot:gene25672-32156_t
MAAVHLLSSNDTSYSPSLGLSPSTLSDIAKIKAMAVSLGLEVVGCAVGTRDVRGEASRPWSAAHVLTSLQVSEAVRGKLNESIILSVSDVNSTKEAVRVEGYQLSAQAVHLAASGVLTSSSASRRAQSARKGSDYFASARVGRIDERDRLLLSDSVLFRGEEDRVVDAHLFAVAVPVQTHSKAACMTHDFPTDLEMRDSAVASAAKTFLVRLIRKVSPAAARREAVLLSTDVLNRLRDPHLLLFLGDLMSKRDAQTLCKVISPSNATETYHLPRAVVTSLQQIALSLEQSMASDHGDENEL